MHLNGNVFKERVDGIVGFANYVKGLGYPDFNILSTLKQKHGDVKFHSNKRRVGTYHKQQSLVPTKNI